MDKLRKKKPWIQRYIWYVIISAAILVLTINQLAFADHSSKLNVDIEKLSVKSVKYDTFQEYISLNGTVEPIRAISILPLVGGKVEEKLKEEGDTVKRNDVILRLKNPELEQMIIDLRAELDREKVGLRQSVINEEKKRADLKSQLLEMEFSINNERRSFEEREYEFNKGMIPKNSYLKAKESYEYALKKNNILIKNIQRDSILSELNIELLKNKLKQKEENFRIEERKLDNLNVKVPLDGRLSSLEVELGGQLVKNQKIGYIRDLSDLKIVASIDEHYSSRISEELRATCEVNNQPYSVYIDKVSSEVVNGKFQIELLFDKERPDMIRVGQSYRIILQLGEPKQSLLIPRGGFYQSTGGQWIFVIDKTEEYAYKKEIKLGRQNPSCYEVIEGLESGDKVIVSGYENYGDVEKLVLKK